MHKKWQKNYPFFPPLVCPKSLKLHLCRPILFKFSRGATPLSPLGARALLALINTPTGYFKILADYIKICGEHWSEALLSLDPNKATDPDSIPCHLLKETGPQIAPSLTRLFNLSLCCGTLPDDRKLANIISVYIKGEKQYVDNYHPIVSKVLECCVVGKIGDRIFCLISCIQHGFTSGKSCTTQLLKVHDHIGLLLDASKQTDIIHCI